ncbi:MAG: hypothetical protein IJJ56_01260 [Prevotella sp.]|nr:hypothetical protein [Prevotella sp.]
MGNVDKNPVHGISEEDTLQSPEQISDHLRVTIVPTYLLATAATLLLAAFIVWGVFGTVSDKAYYSGVVFPAQGTTDITLPNKGIVRSMMVRDGDSVRVGQTVALVSIGDSHSFLTSTVNGLVISTKADNEPFEAFDPIVSVVGSDNVSYGQSQSALLLAYANNEAQRNLRIGMEAEVWPADQKRDEIGYVRGRISQVVRYPADAAKVRQMLKSDILAKQLLEQDNVVYEVLIDLQRDPADPTCYDWSFGQPDNVSMDFGTYCSVLTETRRCSMFQYLFETSRTHVRNLKLRFE